MKSNSFWILLCLVAAAPRVGLAAVIVDHAIRVVTDSGGQRIGTSVDQWGFSVGALGTVSIDILSWEATGGLFERPIDSTDLNGDGGFFAFDSMIHVFSDDGLLSPDDLLASNDDSNQTFSDGSIRTSDAFVSKIVQPGDYIVAVGAFVLSVEDAISGLNTDPFRGGFFYPLTVRNGDFVSADHGAYRITVDGNVSDLTLLNPESTISVGAPSSLALLSSGMILLFFWRWLPRGEFKFSPHDAVA